MGIRGADIQVEDGNWGKFHNLIWEALASAPLSGSEFRCLMFLFRKTYGWRKSKDTISLSQWSEATGFDRRNVFRALNGLLEKKIIVRFDNGRNRAPSWAFNKYVEQWSTSVKNDNSVESDTSVKNDTPTSVKNDTPTSVKNDTPTSVKNDTHKRKGKIVKEKAASPSVKNDTSLQHDENDGRYTIELLRNSGRFVFFPEDSRMRAMHLEDKYTMQNIECGVNLVVQRNDELVARGDKTIRDPVAYLASVLNGEASPKKKTVKRKGYVIDPVTGERKEVEIDA